MAPIVTSNKHYLHAHTLLPISSLNSYISKHADRYAQLQAETQTRGHLDLQPAHPAVQFDDELQRLSLCPTRHLADPFGDGLYTPHHPAALEREKRYRNIECDLFGANCGSRPPVDGPASTDGLAMAGHPWILSFLDIHRWPRLSMDSAIPCFQ